MSVWAEAHRCGHNSKVVEGCNIGKVGEIDKVEDWVNCIGGMDESVGLMDDDVIDAFVGEYLHLNLLLPILYPSCPYHRQQSAPFLLSCGD